MGEPGRGSHFGSKPSKVSKWPEVACRHPVERPEWLQPYQPPVRVHILPPTSAPSRCRGCGPRELHYPVRRMDDLLQHVVSWMTSSLLTWIPFGASFYASSSSSQPPTFPRPLPQGEEISILPPLPRCSFFLLTSLILLTLHPISRSLDGCSR